MKEIKELTGLYSLNKTIGVELKPVGNTEKLIEARKLIEQDEQRAEDYKIVKDIIDRYHKDFIDKCLNSVKIKKDDLEKYMSLAENSKKNEKKLNEVKEEMRKQITDAFEKNSFLFNQNLIKKYLPGSDSVSEEEKKVVNKFSKITTYFDAFNKNRKNLYSGEAKSGTIVYRLIHENLPMFLDNIASFNIISETGVNEYFSSIEAEFTDTLNGKYLADLFQIDYFNNTLTQKKIDNYNYIVGAVNKAVNLYKQQHKNVRIPLLKTLHKMILSDRVTPSWLPERFESDEEMLTAIKAAYESLRDVLVGDNDDSLRNLLLNIDNFDLEHIYIAKDSGLTSISQQIFGYYDTYTLAIKDQLQRENPNLYDERIDKLYKKEGSFSIAYLNRLVDTKEHITINEYYRLLGSYCREEGKRKDDFFKRIDGAYCAISHLFWGKHGEIAQSDSDIELIQKLFDAYKGLQRFIKPLLGHGDEADKDNEFDAKLRKVWDELDIITPLYDKVRNWLSRKIYNPEKIKLCFENNGKLLSGWSDNQTKSDNGTQYGGYIFRKKNEIGEYDFYLGISADAKLFRRDETICYEDGMYERFDYYHLKPTTLLGKSYIGNYGEDSNAVLSAFNAAITKLQLEKKLVPKDNEKVPTYLKRLKQNYANFYQILMNDDNVVDAYKSMKQHIFATLTSLIRVPAAIELATQTDLDIDELIDEILNLSSESFGYFPVATAAIEEANKREKKPLFLFKMSNKDLSYAAKSSEGLRKSRGTENLHTMYLKALLGMTQNVFSIGSGMVFFRHKTKGLAETTARHKANEFIANKNKLNDKKKSIFDYEIVKNKRFTVDKYFFHLSLNLNYTQPNKFDINSKVRDIIRNGGIKHIIGIDRGERNLLYLSLIDLKGNIVMQKSLNILKDDHNAKETDYKGLLTEREGENKEARRNWKKIANIKDLKRGYLSQVVHIISKMMVEYNAIVVLEDLNPGFIRGRQKIERNVYEQFERMLIDKLNFYVDKHKDANETGGLLHALQLTSEFKNFKKSEHQNGFLFYIPAWNTSKIDPVTGFVNRFDTRYTNAVEAQKFFRKFDEIRYNEEKDWFEFEFDYDKFTQKAHGTRTKWTLCTYGMRLRSSRNPAKQYNRYSELVVLTEEFKRILGEAGIDIHENLKEAICNLKDRKHLEPLMQFMRLLLQLRNSRTNPEEDYILSPVADENGVFYDSRSCGDQLPENADANGAYNIARKGLMLIKQIKEAKELDKIKFDISNKAWLNFAQQKPYKND